ncbi:MAG TPA: ABC transporter permease [Solirubrobacteraceae bacterium]|nr:ABC transporter permease [Solirubrobacteraceae bacterium]
MSGLSYMRFELLRSARNRRYMFFAFGFPLVLYFAIAAPNRHTDNLNGSGISLPLYYMVGLASFGTMATMISAGTRIAGERQAGWTRQLRISPLSTREYFRAKVVTAYVMALLGLLLLYAAGLSLGVHMAFHRWLSMTGLMLAGLLPFAALGVAIGHLLTVDSMGAANGGIISLFAFLGGTWFPLSHHGFFFQLGRLLPSYWLVQASHVSLQGGGWGARGWVTIAIWALAMTVLARVAYRRDTGRV